MLVTKLIYEWMRGGRVVYNATRPRRSTECCRLSFQDVAARSVYYMTSPARSPGPLINRAKSSCKILESSGRSDRERKTVYQRIVQGVAESSLRLQCQVRAMLPNQMETISEKLRYEEDHVSLRCILSVSICSVEASMFDGTNCISIDRDLGCKYLVFYDVAFSLCCDKAGAYGDTQSLWIVRDIIGFSVARELIFAASKRLAHW